MPESLTVFTHRKAYPHYSQYEGEPMPICVGFQLFHRFQKFQVVKLAETIGTTGTN